MDIEWRFKSFEDLTKLELKMKKQDEDIALSAVLLKKLLKVNVYYN